MFFPSFFCLCIATGSFLGWASVKIFIYMVFTTELISSKVISPLLQGDLLPGFLKGILSNILASENLGKLLADPIKNFSFYASLVGGALGALTAFCTFILCFCFRKYFNS